METKEVTAKLLEKRIIGLPHNIDKEIADRVVAGIVELNLKSADEIKLMIDSGGGKVKPAFRLIDLIRLSKAPVSGIVVGMCGSAAILILQVCRKRLSTPHSRFFLHFVRSEFSYKANQTRRDVMRSLAAHLKDTLTFQKDGEDLILSRVKISRNKLRRLMDNGERNGSELTSDEALELGLIDEIVDEYDLL